MDRTNSKTDEDVVEIDLSRLLRFYISHWKAIFLGGLAAASAAFLITFFLITPLYRASVTVYVNNTNNAQSVNEITGGNLSAAQKLVSTYVNIIKSNTVLDKIIDKGELDYSAEQLRKLMSAKQVEDTEMFEVTITHPDPEVAAHIANTVAEVAPASISGFVEGSSAKIIDYAEIPDDPYIPSYEKNIIIGILVGIVLMMLLLTFKYLFNMRLQDEEDMELYFPGIPVLGVIPDCTFEMNKKGGAHTGQKNNDKEGKQDER